MNLLKQSSLTGDCYGCIFDFPACLIERPDDCEEDGQAFVFQDSDEIEESANNYAFLFALNYIYCTPILTACETF